MSRLKSLERAQMGDSHKGKKKRWRGPNANAAEEKNKLNQDFQKIETVRGAGSGGLEEVVFPGRAHPCFPHPPEPPNSC